MKNKQDGKTGKCEESIKNEKAERVKRNKKLAKAIYFLFLFLFFM